MSAQHTQGRISVKGTRLYADDYPGIDCIATMQVSNQPMWEQDARRLAACWNACEGISTEALESEGGAAIGWARTASKLLRMQSQRDELLAALRWVERHPFAHSANIMAVVGPAIAMATKDST